MIRGILDYHIDHFSKSEETWSIILTFTYFKVRRDLVCHFDIYFLFLFTEATPTTCLSDREGIAYHNDQSGKAMPIIPKINGEGLASNSGTIIKL